MYTSKNQWMSMPIKRGRGTIIYLHMGIIFPWHILFPQTENLIDLEVIHQNALPYYGGPKRKSRVTQMW